MPDILHRISIDASPSTVHDLVATKEGVERWWTARPLDGDAAVGEQLLVYFPGQERASAVMQVLEDTPDQVTWRCVDGPDDWRNTVISFSLNPTADGGTTLLFTHADWKQASEFMSGCSTNWGAYLTGLKSGAEGGGFGAYPAGEVSRWT